MITIADIRGVALDASKKFKCDLTKIYNYRSICSYWNNTDGRKLGYRVKLQKNEKDNSVTITKYKYESR